MVDIKQPDKTPHSLQLLDRKSLTMNGVLEVVSFDDCTVVLKTVCGELVIEGQELHISTLDTSRGVVSVNGNVQAMIYYDKDTNGRRGKLGKLIK